MSNVRPEVTCDKLLEVVTARMRIARMYCGFFGRCAFGLGGRYAVLFRFHASRLPGLLRKLVCKLERLLGACLVTLRHTRPADHLPVFRLQTGLVSGEAV